MNTNFERDMVHTFSNIEVKTSIDHEETGCRAGAVAGVTEFKDRSLVPSLTMITQRDMLLLLASSAKGVNTSILYNNKEGEVKHAKWGYKSLLMKRLTTQGKIAEATKFTSYQHILVNEAICYITGIACIEAVGVPAPICSGGNRLCNLKQILDYSKIETIHTCLLKWMCTTGEMSNHQSVACHVDGNKCHPYEIGRGYKSPLHLVKFLHYTHV